MMINVERGRNAYVDWRDFRNEYERNGTEPDRKGPGSCVS